MWKGNGAWCSTWRVGCRGQSEPAVASRGTGLLLPVSMAQVWAIEIVFAGKLSRFERDAAGNWFKHTGQHAHTPDNSAHVADPAQARIIDAALRALDTAAVETRVGPADPTRLAKYGLALPTLIVLFYARDSSTPLTRLEFGAALRQPRPLRPPRAGWHRRNRCGV